MALSAALSTALSGIRTAENRAAATSNNIANASNPDFVRREVDVSTIVVGGAGQGAFSEIARAEVDAFLLRSVREQISLLGSLDAQAGATARYAELVGQPGDARSVSSLLTGFEQSLITLQQFPDDPGAQLDVLNTANALTNELAFLTDAIQAERIQADGEIATGVTIANNALQQISELNTAIATGLAVGQDIIALQDERDRQIDILAEQIGVNVVPQAGGFLAIFTAEGVPLVGDGFLNQFEFTTTVAFDAATVGTPSTVPADVLSDLTVVDENGVSIAPGGAPFAITPVSLASNVGQNFQAVQTGNIHGQFTIRDQTFVQYQEQLDLLAGNLISIFQNSGVDSGGNTLVVDQTISQIRLEEFGAGNEIQPLNGGVPAGPPFAAGLEPNRTGLFVVEVPGVGQEALDPAGDGANFGPDASDLVTFPGNNPLLERGLAGRISVNAFLDPQLGGDLDNLRSGAQAGQVEGGFTVPGLPSGDSTQVNAYITALQTDLDLTIGGVFTPGAGLQTTGTIRDLAVSVVNLQQLGRTTVQESQLETSLFVDTLTTQRLNENGVNVDVELSTLLETEELFAANARVIQTVARLLDELIAIR